MEGKITNVYLESGDSGYEVKCCCMEKRMGGGEYDSMMPRSYEFYFSEDDAEKAFKKFKELDEMKKGEED